MKKINLFGIFLLMSLSLQAGSVKYIAFLNRDAFPDTNIIVRVEYPPLTKRDGAGLNIPLPPKEHPRLFFRNQDIPALKQKVRDTLMKQCWDRIQQAAGYRTDGRLNTNGSDNNNNNQVRNAIEAKALLYAFTKDKKTGREAIDILLNYYATLKINWKDISVVQNEGLRYSLQVLQGVSILTGAMVYDWCYDLLSGNEKNILIGRMETLATGLEIGWPVMRSSSIVSHGSEGQLATDMLACGIATYDEKPEIYRLAAGRVMAEFIPTRRFFYPAGFHHQGSSYGTQRLSNDLWTTLIFDRMGYPFIYGKDQGKVPYYWVYLRRPDGQYFRDGDDYKENSSRFGSYWSNPCDKMAGSYFSDPLLLAESLKQGLPGRDYLFDYLFYNINVRPDGDKSHLPLTKYFKEPLGAMVARTSWDEGIASNTVVAEMKLGVYNFVNHQHLDAGNFQIYYKGPLAIESGIYQGKNGGYGSDHFKNYMQRTIAHNSMLIYDPAEKFLNGRNEIINDGGQQYPSRNSDPLNLDDLLGKDYRRGEVSAFYFGPDTMKPEISYLKGDLSKAYSGKVKSFQRSFVFLNLNNNQIPAALIVFDRVVSSDKNFKKTWLLHSVEEPIIDGNITMIKRDEKGYNGKLINTTLLPIQDNLLITKVGGKGKEFTVFDKNFPEETINTERSSCDGAAWRIEISPGNPNETDAFLNVMQVMDYNGGPKKSLSAEKIETDKLVGVKISDRINLFSKDGMLVAESFRLKIQGSGNYKVLIADVEKGNWKIQNLNNKKEPSQEIKNLNKILYFNATKGEYLIQKME